MLDLSLPSWEFILRAVIVYFFLLIALRLIGKKQFGELSPFDLILLLLLSDAVQNSMNGGDESLMGGIITATTLFVLDYIISWITFKYKKAYSLIEGHPKILIRNGRINRKYLNSNRMNKHELEASLREEGCTSFKKVKYAILENNGKITVKTVD